MLEEDITLVFRHHSLRGSFYGLGLELVFAAWLGPGPQMWILGLLSSFLVAIWK